MSPDQARDRAIALATSGAPLSAAEMATIFRLGISQFHKKAKRGTYDAFRLKPSLGPKSYSGVLVSRYLKGEPLYIPTFGRKQKAS